jgi:hypothetical protein
MSTVKVNTVDKRTGSTLTLGGCGTTVTLGAGATQSGFGRTGTVDWCTTAKTAPFTGVSGNGYFVNTTCGAVTVTLPGSPSAGDIISIADYASTFQTNNLTLCRNSSKINGTCTNATLSTQGQSITLVYVDATRGWKNTMDSTSNVTGAPNYIIATGGTISCCGDYKIHTFTSDGCFAVTNAGNPLGSNSVDYLVVAGGGGAGQNRSGGGGAGGYRESSGVASGCYSVSPLGACVSALPVSATTYPVTVGGGGAGSPTTPVNGSVGSNSIFSTIISTGGGGGNSDGAALSPANQGGSGGGGSNSRPGSSGNTPPVSPPQGNNGGNSANGAGGGGGGGATAAGTNQTPTNAGPGGAGATTSISGSPTAYAGGGGGGQDPGTAGTGGSGGGGNGVAGGNTTPGNPGTANTGGGGGGTGQPGGTGGSGGSGIVIIRYKFQ